MACEGAHPVVAIYSTFLQRAYDQLIHDVALQDLPVLFAIDRAGLVGPDGPTHSGSFDLSFLRCIPNMVIMAPADEDECRLMLTTGFRHPGPAAVRYPRGKGPGVLPQAGLRTLPIGKEQLLREGHGVAVLAFGAMVTPCRDVAAHLDATLVNMRFVKPMDETMICEMAARHELLVTVEENAIAGGAGSAVAEILAAHGLNPPLLHIGIPDRYFEHASREECLAAAGLDATAIEAQVMTRVRELGLPGALPLDAAQA
jgi:1-deoxy-D-xylulose-5-phosphate synthase